ncbi:MAG: hypothetical protein ACLTDR_12400 [Adlercreutzia equolifaciens]
MPPSTLAALRVGRPCRHAIISRHGQRGLLHRLPAPGNLAARAHRRRVRGDDYHQRVFAYALLPSGELCAAARHQGRAHPFDWLSRDPAAVGRRSAMAERGRAVCRLFGAGAYRHPDFGLAHRAQRRPPPYRGTPRQSAAPLPCPAAAPLKRRSASASRRRLPPPKSAEAHMAPAGT